MVERIKPVDKKVRICVGAGYSDQWDAACWSLAANAVKFMSPLRDFPVVGT